MRRFYIGEWRAALGSGDEGLSEFDRRGAIEGRLATRFRAQAAPDHGADHLGELQSWNRLRPQDHFAVADSITDGVRVAFAVDPRERPPELPQVVGVGVPNHRFAVRVRPEGSARIEVDPLGPEI